MAPINKTLACKRSVPLSLKGSDFTDRSFWSRSRGADVALVGKSDTAEEEKKEISASQTDKREIRRPSPRPRRIRLLFL